MLNALLLATCAALGQLSLRGQSYYPLYRIEGRPLVSGGYAYYLTAVSGLTVFDVSDPANPTPVASYPVQAYGSESEMYVDGDLLYVPDQVGKLLILDVSTPTSLALVGSLAIQAPSVVAGGGYAYIAVPGAQQLQVVDVSNPASPSVVGFLGVAMGGIPPMALSGDYVYIGKHAVSVADKTAPTLVASLSGKVTYLAVVGNWLYIDSMPFRRVDITDPASSFVLGPQVGSAGVSWLQADGGRLYTEQSSGLVVLDESTHAVLGQLPGPYEYNKIKIADEVVYTGESSVQLCDFSDPTSMSLLGQWDSDDTYSAARGVAASGDGATAFVVDLYKGLLIYDVTQPTPVLLATVTGSFCRSVAVRGRTVYFSCDGKGFTAVDVSTPSSPVTVADVSTGDASSGAMHIEGTKLYVGVSNSGAQVAIYDVTNPVPVLLGSTPLNAGVSQYDALGVVGGYLYVGGSSVYIYDVSNPASPSQVVHSSSFPSSGLMYSVVQSGSYAYVAFRHSFLVLDVTDPTAPTVVGTYSHFTLEDLRSVAVVGSTAYLAQSSEFSSWSLAVVDITNPLSPSPITTHQVYGEGSWVAVHGSRVYLADKGLFVYDMVTFEIGCFKSDVRFLTYAYGAADNTPAKCADWCRRKGHTYAGVEFGGQCWCGSSASGAVKTASSECEKKTCTGDATDHCGGVHRVRLFSLVAALSQPTPEEVGCFSTDESPRKLDALVFTSDKTTVEECTSACEWNGYKYAGLEFGDECWCGNTLPEVRAAGKCSFPCSGDASEMCGNGYRASVYVLDRSSVAVPTPELVGCFSTDESPRQLGVVAYTGSGNTVELCAELCNHNGYKYAGLEYGDECWCGDALPEVRVGRDQCTKPCSGDASEMCGNGRLASVYVVDGSSVAAVSKTYEGCYADSPSRILPVRAFRDDTWCTVDECVAVCNHNGYAFAGLQARKECWCGATLPVGPPLADGSCRMSCSGNSAEVCGYVWMSSVYSTM